MIQNSQLRFVHEMIAHKKIKILAKAMVRIRACATSKVRGGGFTLVDKGAENWSIRFSI